MTPDGYDAPGQVSSAYDLSLFARSGLQNPDFREYCSTASAQFPGDKGKDGKRATFGIQNTNRLLSGDYDMKPYPGIAGVKNGSTTNAGSTFTGVAQRGDRKLLVTVMNPEKKEHNEAYQEAAKLLDWGFAAADKVEPVGRLVGPRSEDDGTGAVGAKGKGKGARPEHPGRAGRRRQRGRRLDRGGPHQPVRWRCWPSWRSPCTAAGRCRSWCGAAGPGSDRRRAGRSGRSPGRVRRAEPGRAGETGGPTEAGRWTAAGRRARPPRVRGRSAADVRRPGGRSCPSAAPARPAPRALPSALSAPARPAPPAP